jgi:hypothetical protein
MLYYTKVYVELYIYIAEQIHVTHMYLYIFIYVV